MFKVFNNKRCFLFQNDKLVLDAGYDDILVQNTEFTPLAIEFKNAS